MKYPIRQCAHVCTFICDQYNPSCPNYHMKIVSVPLMTVCVCVDFLSTSFVLCTFSCPMHKTYSFLLLFSTFIISLCAFISNPLPNSVCFRLFVNHFSLAWSLVFLMYKSEAHICLLFDSD